MPTEGRGAGAVLRGADGWISSQGQIYRLSFSRIVLMLNKVVSYFLD